MSAPGRLGAQDGALALGLGPGWRRVRTPLIALAVLALANVALAAFLTFPTWRAAAAEGAVERAGLQATEAIEPALQRARRVYGRILDAEQEAAALRALVARRSGTVSEVVSTLRAALDASGLTAERINYQPAPLEELGLTQLQIDLPVRGTYGQLRRFLDHLLDGPMFVIVERVGASTPSSGASGSGLMLNVGISVFLAPEAALDAVDAQEPPLPDPQAFVGRDPVGFAEGLRVRLAGLPEIPLPDEAFALELDPLEASPDAAAPTDRDLFAFAWVPPPPTPRVAPEERERRRRDLNFVPEPVIPYDLLGVIRTGDGLIATLSDGDNVYNVAEGDLLPDGVRVRRITLVEAMLESGMRHFTLSLRHEDDIEPGGRRADRKKKKDGGDDAP